MLKKIITEPLIHFLFIAIVFFIIFDRLNSNTTTENIIKVSEARIEQIRQSFLTRWNREPQPKELENAAQHFAINEMYLREARALSLDIGDKVIDRRLRQKMDFLIEDLVTTKEPTTEELQSYYQQNIANYRTIPTYSLQQVHISIDRTPEQLKKKLDQQLKLINQGLSPQSEITLLPAQINQKYSVQIDRLFGDGFSEKLNDYPLSKWSGPIISTVGQHFVFIEQKQLATDKPFESVKQSVLKDWQYQNLQEAKASFEQKLMQRYTIERASEKESE
ncbi:peptidylprolyl isomerase [Thalassotalea psychrophila]|uniref:Peptidylprolyl isomerase n=1 Tax=Thalassotalea psychrophila TaxID=3065647 RepID=A0ABY9TYC8_9GAMM|nr:peptidylprolyl isomerase [Colwelliaceae bacterium SQ149]